MAPNGPRALEGKRPYRPADGIDRGRVGTDRRSVRVRISARPAAEATALVPVAPYHWEANFIAT